MSLSRQVAVHPLAKPAIRQAIPTDAAIQVDGRILTARDEKELPALIPHLLEALR